MSHQDKVGSPSRTYVAVCNKTDFDGFYCLKFTLPVTFRGLWSEEEVMARNDCSFAAWYFLNQLNFVACLERVMTFEDYSNLEDQS